MAIEIPPGLTSVRSPRQTPVRSRDDRRPVVAVVGTSAMSGKSTALSSMVRGLTRSGMRVAAGTATATGTPDHSELFRDAGASAVLDFTDLGYSSTQQLDQGVSVVFASLIRELAATGADAVVVEIADDGGGQRETTRLLADPAFSEYVDHVVCTARDAASAIAGVAALRIQGIGVVGVTGLLTASRLAIREARLALDVPVVPTFHLCQPEVVFRLLSAPEVAG